MCEKNSSQEIRRERVFNCIEDERDYQDALNTETMSVGEELLLMQEYLDRARRMYSDTFGQPHETPTLHIIRKIAGIATRCMEHHGAPERTTDG